MIEFVGQELTHAPSNKKKVAAQVVQVVASVQTSQSLPQFLQTLSEVSPNSAESQVADQVLSVLRKFGLLHPVQFVPTVLQVAHGEVQAVQSIVSVTRFTAPKNPSGH